MGEREGETAREQNRALPHVVLYSSALGVQAQLCGQGMFYLLSKSMRTFAHEQG